MPEIAPAGPRYLELVRAFPLRVLRSEPEAQRASEVLDSLAGDHDLDVHEYRLALAALVERYEDENEPALHGPHAPAEMLRFLMEARGLSQIEVILGSGVPASTLSEVLSGRREMSRGVMRKLGEYFRVEPGLFV